ncbi:MAG: glycosyltransferase [Gemmatimonadota bacterium]|nr:glycosyltransferase [Gemmatimonadota bacterium]
MSAGTPPDTTGAAVGRAGPYLSVIVPAHQASGVLPDVLTALRESRGMPVSWELIVVDDASTDDTTLTAARYADVIVALRGNPHGPAYARNRGVEASRGEVIVFVDSDVVVRPDALARLARCMIERPEITAVFGAYDNRPRAPGVVSQYRNLLHHWVHVTNGGEAETFWAGLGGVRRDAFMALGMFNEWHFSHPQIEDIELGRRLRQAGRRILLVPEIQGTHLKRWTLAGMIGTDLRNRGVPWMWMVLREGASEGSKTLNLRKREKICTALAGLGFAALLATPLTSVGRPLMAAGAACLVAVLGLNWKFLRYARRHGGWGTLAVAIPLQLAFYLLNVLSAVIGWIVYQLLGEPQPPPERQAQATLAPGTWPPPPKRPVHGLRGRA